MWVRRCNESLSLFTIISFHYQVRKYLIPDANDEIRQEQMREMEIMAKRNSSPSPGSFSGCTVTSASGTFSYLITLLMF